jgi:hypothetical protein
MQPELAVAPVLRRWMLSLFIPFEALSNQLRYVVSPAIGVPVHAAA